MIGHHVRRALAANMAAKAIAEPQRRQASLMQDLLDEFFFKQKQRVARNLKYQVVKQDRGEITNSPGLVKDRLDLDSRR